MKAGVGAQVQKWNVFIANLFEEVKKAYQDYDNNRANGGKSKVSRGEVKE